MARLRPLSRTTFFSSLESPRHKRFKNVHVASFSLRDTFPMHPRQDLSLLRIRLLRADLGVFLPCPAGLAEEIGS